MTAPAAFSSRVRFSVLGFLCLLSMITYLDRVCMSETAKYIAEDFNLNKAQLGWIFSAFTFAYAAFEVPSGWLGDVFGPRGTLIRIVISWSLFTALTGLIWPDPSNVWVGFWLLFIVRFCFGAGEAGAYPNIARAIKNWFPSVERGSAKGAIWMAGRFMGGLSPLIVTLLVYEYTTADGKTATAWRHTFWLFGAVGLVWCAWCWWWMRDTPLEHPGVSAAERTWIEQDGPSSPEREPVPWRRLFTSVNLWAMCIIYFCMSYGWYFFITFYPTFLKERLAVTRETWGLWAPLAAGAPLLVGSVSCLVGGFLTDRWSRTSLRWGRRYAGFLGHGVAAMSYAAAIFVFEQPTVFILLMALVALANDLTMGSCWAVCLDIGGKYAGVVSGCMNTVGNLGGAVAGVVTGQIVQAFSTGADPTLAWKLNLGIYAGMYLIAVGLWLRVDATEKLA